MKIPRFTAGQTNNVAMIQEGNRALQTPAQAAAFAAAPYAAVSDIADTAGDAINTYKSVKDEMDRADDKLTNAIEDGYYEQALEQAKAEHTERSLNDPNWKQDDYLAEINAIHEARRGGLEQLKNPEVRQRSQQLFEANKNLLNSAALYDANIIHANKVATKWQSSFNEAIEAKDYAKAQMLLNLGRDDSTGKAIVGELPGQEAQAKLDEMIKNQDFSDKADDLEKLAINDPAAAIAEIKAVSELGMNSEDTEKLERMLIGAFGQAQKIRKFEETERNDEYQNVANQDVLELQMGKSAFGSPDEIIAKYEANEYGDITDPATFKRVQQVLSAYGEKLKGDKSQSDFLERYRSPIAMEDIKSNREDFGRYLDAATEGMTPEEAADFTMKAVNHAGFPTQQMRTELKRGLLSQEGMKQTFPLFMALTSLEKRFGASNLGLTDSEFSEYTYIKTAVEYSNDPDSLAAAVERLDDKKTNPLTATNDVWTEEVYGGKTGSELMLDEFKEYSKSGQFEEHFFFDPEESPRNQLVKRELQNRFMFEAKDQLELGASPAQAAHSANQIIESRARTTDINGYKETQLNLPPGSEDIKMGHLRKQVVGKKGRRGGIGLFSGKTVLDGEEIEIQHYLTADGALPVDTLDEDKVRLYVPMRKEDSRTPEGEVVFEIHYDNSPLYAETEKGKVPMIVSFPPSELASEEQKQESKRNILAEKSKLDKELDALIAEQASREGHGATSGLNIYGTPNLDEEIRKAQAASDELTRQWQEQNKAR
jgi:hypothetical protein